MLPAPKQCNVPVTVPRVFNWLLSLIEGDATVCSNSRSAAVLLDNEVRLSKKRCSPACPNPCRIFWLDHSHQTTVKQACLRRASLPALFAQLLLSPTGLLFPRFSLFRGLLCILPPLALKALTACSGLRTTFFDRRSIFVSSSLQGCCVYYALGSQSRPDYHQHSYHSDDGDVFAALYLPLQPCTCWRVSLLFHCLLKLSLVTSSLLFSWRNVEPDGGSSYHPHRLSANSASISGVQWYPTFVLAPRRPSHGLVSGDSGTMSVSKSMVAKWSRPGESGSPR